MNTKTAAQTARITYRQLDHWITLGYLRIGNDPNPGSGHQRELTTRQLAILVRIADLVRLGVKPDVAAKYARTLRLNGKVTVGNLTITEGDVA